MVQWYNVRTYSATKKKRRLHHLQFVGRLYVGTLEQCYRFSNIICYWVSHRQTIPYQRMDP